MSYDNIIFSKIYRVIRKQKALLSLINNLIRVAHESYGRNFSDGVSKFAHHSEYDLVLSLPSLISIPDLSTATLRLTVPSSYSPTDSISFLNFYFFRFTLLWDDINPLPSSCMHFKHKAIHSENGYIENIWLRALNLQSIYAPINK